MKEIARTEVQRRPATAERHCDLRCDCGSLLARRAGDHIELKCRRCKRVVGIAVIVAAGGNGTCDAC